MLALERHRLGGLTSNLHVPELVKRAGQRRNLPRRNITTSVPSPKDPKRGPRPYVTVSATLLAIGGTGYVAYENYQPFRHTVLAVARCSRVAGT